MLFLDVLRGVPLFGIVAASGRMALIDYIGQSLWGVDVAHVNLWKMV